MRAFMDAMVKTSFLVQISKREKNGEPMSAEADERPLGWGEKVSTVLSVVERSRNMTQMHGALFNMMSGNPRCQLFSLESDS